jgi:hypothetical protein
VGQSFSPLPDRIYVIQRSGALFDLLAQAAVIGPKAWHGTGAVVILQFGNARSA